MRRDFPVDRMMVAMFDAFIKPGAEPRKFGEKVPGPELCMANCDPSRHNSKNRGQVERARKNTRRANRLKFKGYRRKANADS